MDKIDGIDIMEKRARAVQYRADQLHITYAHCPTCGAILHNGGCWYGCLNRAALASQREVDAAIIAAYDKVKAGFSGDESFDDEPACGNYRAEEADYMRHPA